MIITPSLFDAFLKCPTKCWLRFKGESNAGHDYAKWVQTQNESFRVTAANRLIASMPADECAPPLRSSRHNEVCFSAEEIKSGKWRLALDTPVRIELCSSRGNEALASSTEINQSLLTSAATAVESHLHAIERVPSAARGKAAQFIPIRFVFRNKLTSDDKLLAAFDAFVFSEMLGREISLGKIIHGDDHATLKVKTSALAGEVRKRLDKIAALLSSPAPPDLVLNRHCAECEFRDRCRKIAVEKDDLSLLAGMSAKERQKLRSKGIFTVTQLSYTFRPRRRPKRLRDKREKYHHSLKALAIREKKIHIVGSPELMIEGTPVYLDVEGVPDRDFYYLIGLRIGHGESAVQHSLWADTVEDEGKIWREFLAILETVEKPVLIHYGSYEMDFMRKMKTCHGSPLEGSLAETTMASSINLISVMFAHTYFPTYSNGLKEIADWLGFDWFDPERSGISAIAWRSSWETTRDPVRKARLLNYNARDCEALEQVCSVIRSSISPNENRGTAVMEREIVRVESINNDRLQKWREFKSPFPKFESFARAAHWKYRQSRVIAQPGRVVCRLTSRVGKPNDANVYKEIFFPSSRVCPQCKKRKRGCCREKTRYRLELFIGRASLKVRLVKHVFQTYFCRRCNLTFGHSSRFKDLRRFGWSLTTFLVHQVVGLNIPQRVVAESFTKSFGIPMSAGTLHDLKAHVADYYRETWRTIIISVAHGQLVHADETKIHLHNSSGYVWVLTNMHQVAYVFSRSREGELPQGLLADFRGVLVSDFYAAYDSLDCKHQRCLIHLIRDLNDEVLNHPFDEELKSIVLAFVELLGPIIETIDRRGLKHYFLRKFKVPTGGFFRRLARMRLTTDASRKCRLRFEKNQDELFTFLDHDNVPWHNNNAEHAIKAVARLRNVISGLSTEKGLEEYLVLLSICQTCKYMGMDFLDFLRSGEKDIHAFAESRRGRRQRTQTSSAS